MQLGDANGSATGGDGNEGLGVVESTAARMEMATLGERGSLVEYGDTVLRVKWRCTCLSGGSTARQK